MGKSDTDTAFPSKESLRDFLKEAKGGRCQHRILPPINNIFTIQRSYMLVLENLYAMATKNSHGLEQSAYTRHLSLTRQRLVLGRHLPNLDI
jgi:hypothetical protein